MVFGFVDGEAEEHTCQDGDPVLARYDDSAAFDSAEDAESNGVESGFAALTISGQQHSTQAPAIRTVSAATTTVLPDADVPLARQSITVPAATPQERTRTTTSNPFAKLTAIDIELTTSGLSSRIEIVARSAQRARFAISKVISPASVPRENSEQHMRPPSTFPSTLSKPAVNAQGGQISAKTLNSLSSSVRNDAQRVQDFSIGFQGELFVFELLKFHLLSFIEEN